jgi:undecaprenyl-diphosphatase
MHGLITLIAKDFIIFSVLIPIIVWWRIGRQFKKRFILVVLGGAIVTVILAKIGSHLFYDPRPFVAGHFTPYFSHGNDNGFPSDHTLLAAVLAFATWHYSKKAGYVLFVLTALIGLSRVIAGVHHLGDIIGSIVFAYVGVTLVYKFLERSPKDRPRKRVAHPEV